MRYKQIVFNNEKINFILFDNEYISNYIYDNNSFYELENLEILNYLPLEEGVFLDIGANIGNHTLYFSKILKRDVYAFEPVRENYNLLRKNILINDLKNIKTFNIALGMCNSKVTLRQNYQDNSGTWEIVDYTGDIDIIPLDDININKKISYMKIDVEGHELEVLKGAINTIKTNLPLLSIEFHSGNKFKELKDFLSTLGYVEILVLGRSNNAIFIHSSKISKQDLLILQNFLLQLIRRDSLKSFQSYIPEAVKRNTFDTFNINNQKIVITNRYRNKLLDKAYLKELEFEVEDDLENKVYCEIIEKIRDIKDKKIVINFSNFSNIGFNELKFIDGKIYFNDEEIAGISDLSSKTLLDIIRKIINNFDYKFYTLVNFDEINLKFAHELFELNNIEYGIFVDSVKKLHWEKWSLISNANLIFSNDKEVIEEFKKNYIFNIKYKDFISDEKVFDNFKPSIKVNKNKKRVLIISYYYKPVLSVGIFRPEYWFENLSELSKGEFEVELVTAMRQVEKKDNIHYVPDFGTVTGITTPIDIKIEHEKIKKMVNTVAFSWTSSLEEYFNSHPEYKYDYVILTGNPFMHFYFSEYAKKKWNAKVLQDYRDPMGKNPRFYSKDPAITKLNEEMRQKYEDIFCSMSDKVITVNEYCANLLSDLAPKPIEVIRNGYNDKIVDNLDKKLLEEVGAKYPKIPFESKKSSLLSFLFRKRKKRSPNNRVIRLCYAGSFAHDRKPENLINSVKNVLGYELHHFGTPYPKIEKSTNKRLVSHGKKSYEEVIANLKYMDIGVVYCSHDFESTTKIYDYIACNNIILVITSKENPRPFTLSKELEGLEHVYWVVNDEKEITKFLTSTIFPEKINRPQREAFSRKAGTMKLINLLQRIRDE